MNFLYKSGLILIFLGIIYYLPFGQRLIKNKALPQLTGLILIILGVYLIIRALTL